MDIESLRSYCLSKPGVEESFPFGIDTLVFKVGGKIFLICTMNSEPLQFNVKCDPEKAIELRERYGCVQPGYHMNKKHWNTVVMDGSVSNSILKEWIDASYGLVVDSLPAKAKALLRDK